KRPAHFIYPNENAVKGSTTLFNALLRRCTQRDKIPICRITLRRQSAPNIVALFPQLECKPLDKAGGFHVIYLPFKENVRYPSIKEAEAVDIEPNALELASNIVEKLSFNFDTKDFPNPVLQTHWRFIEGLATGVDPEPFDESQTQPNYENIEEKAGYDMYQLNDMLD
ncbi:unnamed protein product, partial [Oppiella nova]